MLCTQEPEISEKEKIQEGYHQWSHTSHYCQDMHTGEDAGKPKQVRCAKTGDP